MVINNENSVMKLNIQYFVFFFLLMMALLGCDPLSSYKVYVKNDSQYNLKVFIYDQTDLRSNRKPYDSVTVNKGTTSLLKSSDERATIELCTNKKDSIAVVINDNFLLKVVKDLNSENSYQSNKSGNSGKGYTIKCEAIISDADVMPK